MAACTGEGTSKQSQPAGRESWAMAEAALPQQFLQMLTFDDAGGDDALGRSPITSGDNAGLVQVGPRHHHLLQVLGKGVGGEESSLQPPAQQGRQGQGAPGDTRRHLCHGWTVDNGQALGRTPFLQPPPPGLSASPLNSALESSTAGLFPGPGPCAWLASENSQGPKLLGGAHPVEEAARLMFSHGQSWS